METNKFFLYLNRINSILFLIALVVLIIGLVGYAIDVNTYLNKRSVKVEVADKNSEKVSDKNSNKKETIELSGVNAIDGHDIHTVSAWSQKNGLLKSGKFSTRVRRNILFLDRDEEPKWLFDNNEQVIITYRELNIRISRNNRDRRTDYIYYEIIRKDTNNDGMLSSKDKIEVGISNPNGTNYRVLGDDITRVVNDTYFPKKKVIKLFLQIDNKLVYRSHELETGRILTEKIFANYVSDME